MNSNPSVQKSTQFVVRLTNGIAIKFHKNFTSHKVYSVVRDEEASTFDAKWEAELKAAEHGMNSRDFYVGTIEGKEPYGN